MLIQCEWCNKKEAVFELAVYYLKELTTFKRSQHVDSPTRIEYKKTGRGQMYTSVKICESCLPVTSIKTIQVEEKYMVTRQITEKK